jgi:hypothetical protein
MGLSEWGIRITNRKEYADALRLINMHNESDPEEVGEDLEFYAVIKFEGALYMCCGNSGGRSYTSNFLERHDHTGLLIYHPFEKPPGWFECEDYVWESEGDDCCPTAEQLGL